MISHRNISAWPDRLEDVYDVATDEPWFRNLDPESDELFREKSRSGQRQSLDPRGLDG